MQKRYKQSLESYLTQKKRVQRELSILHFVRLISFLLFAATALLTFTDGFSPLYATLSTTLLLLFIAAAKRDVSLSREQRVADIAIKMYQDELNWLDFKFESNNNGEEYIALNPNLACDFDLFGRKSLFDYLLRSTTKWGVDKFARSLITPIFDNKAITLRAEAIEELSQNREFVDAFRIQGILLDERGDELDNLIEYLSEKDRKIAGLNALCYTIPVVNVAIIIAAFAGIIPLSLISIPIAISLPVVYLNYNLLNKAHNLVGRSSKTLNNYSSLIAIIERSQFKSSLLREYQDKIVSGDRSASRSISKLKGIVESFDTRYNVFASFILNTTLLFELQNYRRLISWKRHNKEVVRSWFEALSDIDSLIGYAVYGANCREFTTLATLSDKRFEISGVDISHPLISPVDAVANSIAITKQPSTMVITGANMAGKSTYLRTTVTNLILAMNGARVRAQSFTFTPCQILSSIKIQDSLSDKESYFYAELKRLKFILDNLKEQPQTLVILDEMLRGTNSRDKQQGSIGYIENILKNGGVAIVATHDLAIGDMATTYPELISNYCFEVELNDNRLKFDYTLKPGVTTKLNASFLMSEMGIITTR